MAIGFKKNVQKFRCEEGQKGPFLLIPLCESFLLICCHSFSCILTDFFSLYLHANSYSLGVLEI